MSIYKGEVATGDIMLGNKNTAKYLRYLSWFYLIIFTFFYAIIPSFLLTGIYGSYVNTLSFITVISCIVVFYSSNTSFRINLKVRKIRINYLVLVIVVFSLFLLSMIVTLLTADKIPIIESFRGADASDLAMYREEFSKARSGWEQSLAYINGAFTGAVIPYLICSAFEKKFKYRYWLALIFVVYSISFLEKAYFLKMAIPLFFIFYFYAKNKKLYVIKGLAIIITLLIFMAVISHSGSDSDSSEVFFSTGYIPSSPLVLVVWRSIVVPIVTAMDSIRVFASDFHGNYFYGSTSSLIALITGETRLNFERVVFESQWGQNSTGTGNANAVYLIEAYVNFGVVGVILFSVVIGKLFRFMIKHGDKSLIAIAPLFIFNLFNAGLIGTLFSNGYLFLFLLVGFFKIKYPQKNTFSPLNKKVIGNIVEEK